MGFNMSQVQFDRYLNELMERFTVYAPKVEKGKGKFAETDVVGYGTIHKLADIEWEQKSYFSPKEIFYPIRETLFYFKDEEILVPSVDSRPVVIFLRPCDLNGIRKLDTIFLKNGKEKDFYYKRRRDLIKFVLISCTEGFDRCFCVSMKSNRADDYDAAVSISESGISLKIVDESLKTPSLNTLENVPFEPEFIQANKVKVTVPEVSAIGQETFEHDLWKSYAGRCIGCGRCNTSCISCACFTMQDVKLSDDNRIGERRRVWAGCHVDGFTDMAGGHTFRKSNGDRMRFKTMHKINDFHKRFDEHMCVGCGRCDDVCPEYISFSNCINRLSKIVEGESDHE